MFIFIIFRFYIIYIEYYLAFIINEALFIDEAKP